MLQLQGACSPADMRAHLAQACAARDTLRAADGGPLVLPSLGPAGVRGRYGTPALPLRISRLPQREGGLAQPDLHTINRGAHTAQLVATVPAQMLHMLPHIRAPTPADGGGGGDRGRGAASDTDDDFAGDSDSDNLGSGDERGGDGAAAAMTAAAVPLPPMLAAKRTLLRHFLKLAAEEDEREERQQAGFSTQFDGDGDAILVDSGTYAAATAAAARASQHTQRDDDGDVIMGLGAYATTSTSSDSDGSAAARGARGRRGAAPSTPPGAFTPPSALDGVIPTPLLEWAARGPATLDGLICACVRVVASSPQTPATEELLRAAGKMGYLDRVASLPVVDRDSPSQQRERGGRGGGGRGRGGNDRDDDEPPKVQRTLTALVIRRQRRMLESDLRGSGEDGQAALAQLRSQRGPGAMAWLSCSPGRISPFAAAQMVLLSLFVWDPWRLEGPACPFCHTEELGGPTALHALACPRQFLRGAYSTHTAVRNGMLRMLRRHHAQWVTVEDASPFLVADCRMDIVVAPQTLSLAPDEAFALKGVLLDHTVRCPTMPTYVRQASSKTGYLARAAEKDKQRRYNGTFDTGRYILVPFVQETFGLIGKQALNFVRMLAAHSAASLGGGEKVVERRAGMFHRQIVTELSLSLARELAERVLAYVRGAARLYRRGRPVSALLALSPSPAA